MFFIIPIISSVVVGATASELAPQLTNTEIQSTAISIAPSWVNSESVTETDLDNISLATVSAQVKSTTEPATKQVLGKNTEKPVQNKVEEQKTVVKKEAVAPQTTTAPAPQPALEPHALDALFEKYGAQYGVEPRKLKAIAKCESGYNAASQSKNGLYGGMYQYLASTWSGTRKQMGENPDPALRFNAEEAIKTTAWKIAQGGIGAWPVCGKK